MKQALADSVIEDIKIKTTDAVRFGFLLGQEALDRAYFLEFYPISLKELSLVSDFEEDLKKYALQVSRLLCGGSSIMGIYLFTNSVNFPKISASTEAALRRLECFSKRYFLRFHQQKLECTELLEKRPVQVKFQRQLFLQFRKFSASVYLNINICLQRDQSLTDQIFSNLCPLFENMSSDMVLVDDLIISGETAVESLKMQHQSEKEFKNTHNIRFLSSLR